MSEAVKELKPGQQRPAPAPIAEPHPLVKAAADLIAFVEKWGTGKQAHGELQRPLWDELSGLDGTLHAALKKYGTHHGMLPPPTDPVKGDYECTRGGRLQYRHNPPFQTLYEKIPEKWWIVGATGWLAIMRDFLQMVESGAKAGTLA